MASLGAALKVCCSISRMKHRQTNKYNNDSIREDDTCEVIFLSHLKLALDNLGGNLTNDEIEILVQGIEENNEKGITYEEFISVLIFASFFISAFDRKGEGSVTGNDISIMILNTVKKEDPYSKSTREKKLSPDDEDDKTDISLKAEINYHDFIEVIEASRLVLGSTYENQT